MEKPERKDSNFKYVLILSFAFQLILGSYYTMAAIEKIILHSVEKDDPSFDGDGFICLALVHIFYGVSNFIAPSVVAAFGVNKTLIVSSVFHAMFIAGFLYPKTWVIYLGASLTGVGAGCLWVANGVYFTKCSTDKTISRNMGIYWAIQASGMVIGNAFTFWRFQGVEHIDAQMRFWVVLIITIVSGMGSVLLCFLTPISNLYSQDKILEAEVSKDINKPETGIIATMKKSFAMLSDKHMQLLVPTSIYAGFEGATFAGIFPTAVGFTEGFGSDAKKYVGLIGILTGLGIMFAGFIFGVVGTKIFKSSCRSVGVLIAGVCHLASIALIYINFANLSTYGPTLDESMISPPSILIAMACAVLLGVGDGCLLPQICAAVGVIWPDDPSGGHAVFRFFQGGTVGVVFVLSTITGLHNFLVIFGVMTIIGVASFWLNENLIKKEQNLLKEIKSISYQVEKELTNDQIVCQKRPSVSKG